MIYNIQYLRFFAALLVVLYHSSDHVRASGQPYGWLFEHVRASGFAGVDIFFVVSGFIVAWTNEQASGRRDALRFMLRRCARVYSGYWLFFLIAIGVHLHFNRAYVEDVDWLTSFFLWPTPLWNLLIPVSWTLIFEMFFYALFTVLIALGRPHRYWLVFSLGVAIVAWSLYSQFVRHAYDPGELEQMNIYEQYFAFPYLIEFLAGSLLAKWLMIRPNGACYSLLLAGVALWTLGGYINNQYFEGQLVQGYYVLSRVSIFGSAALLIVAGLVRLENKGFAPWPRVGLLAGDSCYALYLSHTLVLYSSYRLGLPTLVSSMPAWAVQLTYYGLALLIVVYSVAHYLLAERPLDRLFRRVLRVANKKPVASANQPGLLKARP